MIGFSVRTKSNSIYAFAISAGILLAPTQARAEDPVFEGDRFTHDVAVDLPITFSLISLWVGSQFLQPILAPAQCRVCGHNEDGADALNGFDGGVRNALRWDSPKSAGTISDVLAFGVAPVLSAGGNLLVAGLNNRIGEGGANTLIIAETVAAASVLNQITKYIVGRERPFVYALPEAKKATTDKPSDNNVSFYSGHTTFTFALAVSGGTVAWLRGYKNAAWVWSGGLLVAAAAGYLRIAADKHYMSDVLVGALTGSLVGFSIPYFFHRNSMPAGSPGKAPSSLSISPNGIWAGWQF